MQHEPSRPRAAPDRDEDRRLRTRSWPPRCTARPRRPGPLAALPTWAHYALITALVLASFAARRALEGIYDPPFLTFGPAVLLAALAFGTGAGWFATVLGAALAQHSFAGSGGGLVPGDLGEAVALGGFLGLGLLASCVIGALRRANRRLAEAHRRLAEAHALMEEVVEGAPDPIFAKDAEGRFLLANRAAAHALGVPPTALPGRRLRDLLPPGRAEAIEREDREVIETGRVRRAEELVAAPGAEPRWFRAAKAPWRGPDGRVLGVVGVARDVHERRLAEERLREDAARKALLLADTNHRLKNHLQAVAAILHGDGARSGDARVRAALEDAAGRLRVLARAHERLHLAGSPDAAVVGMRDVLGALAADLRETLLAGRPVALRVEAEAVELAADRAVPAGLVVNEAVTNALKHAFPDGRPGTVLVRLRRREAGSLLLEVADDGIGAAPAGPEGRGGRGGGTRLIGALARQLGGEAEWRGPPGTAVAVRFPEASPT